jgi:hypothetical protein
VARLNKEAFKNKTVRPLSPPVETTWREVVNRIIPLQAQLIGYYDSLGYAKLAGKGVIEDVRAFTLVTCKEDIINSISLLNILMHFGEHPEEEQSFRTLAGALDTSRSELRILERLGEHLKRSLVTMIQFRLDNMVRNILTSLNKAVSNSYVINVDALLTFLQLADMTRKGEILRVLQYVRNMYHNNGTHLFGKPLNIQIENYSFIFDKNCPIDCASWVHVTIAMKATFEVVADILNSAPVKALPWPVPIHVYSTWWKGYTCTTINWRVS